MTRVFGHTFPQGEAYTIPEIPLWVTRLGAVARRIGWEPLFVDFSRFTGPRAQVSVASIVDGVMNGDPRVVCLSPFTANYELAMEVTDRIKTIAPETVVIVGGAHASELPDDALRDGFDLVSVGRGEGPLAHVLGCLGENKVEIPGSPGLRTAMGRQEEDLRQFEHWWSVDSDYSVIPAEYPMHYARIYANLGCPYKCSFCADTLWIGMKPYQRELGQFRRELSEIKDRFSPSVLFIGDEVFTMDDRYCREVVAILGEAGIPWFCQTRANLLARRGDPELLSLMAAAGCLLINIGAESTDAAVLANLRKNVTFEQLVSACERAKEASLSVLTYWMVGGPGESQATARATLGALLDLFDRGLTDLADYFICTPYPGTSIFRDPETFGVTIEPKPWHLWREDIPSVMSTQYLTPEEIYSLWLEGLRGLASAMTACSTPRAS
jgi:radical SAM superfamily enzyme YgiQ (UPF0313 family)